MNQISYTRDVHTLLRPQKNHQLLPSISSDIPYLLILPFFAVAAMFQVLVPLLIAAGN